MYSQGVPYTSEQEIQFNRATLGTQALISLTRSRIEVANPELGVGIDVEFMGNLGNPYLGRLGDQSDIYFYMPAGIEYVPNDFDGNPVNSLDTSGKYLGSTTVGLGVMG